MSDKKFHCYSCKYRATIPGNCHSKCTNPKSAKELNIKGNAHGIKNGWFFFPFNYDPTWLENCDGYEPKEQ